ncbi:MULTISPECIES: amidohydrolase family protein [unclassified Rhizobium]|uniref:amidohydrolase family protein n=1 Tax=unclassified Rhizobium TaxID=2613769 RepID=UPI001160545F|nr:MULTISPECIES: amidohydrolase family protein [unclassified Rhizobium]TQX82892.1 hydrolase [Rhizobium sp. rho-13.1]TQY06070.1 hydrolase [Rhizobium sp. rho-1.1]
MTRYAGPVIDPHHHLWDLGLKRHPWLEKARDETQETMFCGMSALLRNYGIADYAADAARQNVVATVHVEAGWSNDHPHEETAWLDALDHAGGTARRYVARVKLDDPDASVRLAAEAANPRVVGIRDIVSWHPDSAKSFAPRAGRMADPQWRSGLSHVARIGLVFDLMLYPWQMDEARDLVRAFPETLFVLNHGGSPADRTEEGMALWRRGLASLGSEPNIRLKISDLVAYDHAWSFDSLEPVIHHCLESFGVSRCMFASDFPVAGLHATFDEVYEVFLRAAEPLSLHEQRSLFFSTANDTYRLGLGDDEAFTERENHV